MEVFNMKYRLFLVIFLSSMLNILLGAFLQISNVLIGWLVLYSALFEAGVFLLANKGLAIKIKEVDIRNRFKFIFEKTLWFQILLLIFLIIKLYLGLDVRLILFYGHIFIVFNALMYLLSSSQVSLKKNKLSS
ncbi:immunity protein [Streptococcus pneumoniae]|uniref:Immunity protein n=3 Tax=Streptococcus pneumoniae TaxID=1313 RepID=A0AA44MYK5_STREE|nr:immunity protein [Streptococcus pneumoniae]RRR81844.1 immunity protein [Streptococcus pneumoniae]RRR90768.1 immunity protein [Streptococcus pneumoniae]